VVRSRAGNEREHWVRETLNSGEKRIINMPRRLTRGEGKGRGRGGVAATSKPQFQKDAARTEMLRHSNVSGGGGSSSSSGSTAMSNCYQLTLPRYTDIDESDKPEIAWTRRT